MPKWGIEMTEGRIAEWRVEEGKPFPQGTILTAIETDKITNEVEAESEGRFARIIGAPGETYPVGALLAVLAGEDVSAADVDCFIASFKASAPMDAAADKSPAPAPSKPAVAVTIPDDVSISPVARQRAMDSGIDVSAVVGSGRKGRITAQDVEQLRRPARPADLKGPFELISEGKVFASPLARRIAKLHDLPPEGIVATGPRGRICKADVLALVGQGESKSAGTNARVVVMSPMRKAIARRLSEAKATIPHFYLRRRVRMDRVMARRAAETGTKPSINDYLIRACALALIKVPEVNINVHGDEIHFFSQADIAVAVATDKGLLTPVVLGADKLDLAQISGTMRGLADRARSGKLKAEEYTGGSFTISNLGSHGVEQFDAIINPPQGAILAVGVARTEPFDDNGSISLVPVMHLSLSCDHRAIDGAVGGRFLAALVDFIENPGEL